MKLSYQVSDTKYNSNIIDITLDTIYLPENDTTLNSDINDIRLARIQISDYSHSSDDK